MTAEALITLDQVGKQFSKGFEHSHRTLGAELVSLFFGGASTVMRDDPEAFWALRDVSFEVRRGEVLGVLGHNGAGKTTLLRMLNGEFSPDLGTLTVQGQRSSLIDLTGGFSQTMTGRENIYFRGAHLGFDRAFLKSKEEEIIEFTELGDFIDSPIKTYSSGMLLRLGFAVTVLSEPDVLLVDEILSVGDFLFSAKCMRKMNELKRRAAIVQVSHVVEEIINFADHALVLDRGAPVFFGRPAEAAAYYLKLEQAKAELGGSRLSRSIASPLLSESAAESDGEDSTPVEEAVEVVSAIPANADATVLAAKMGHFIYNTNALDDVRAWWCDEAGAPVVAFDGDQTAFMRIEFNTREPIHHLTLGVPTWTADGVFATAFATHARPIQNAIAAGTRHRAILEVRGLHLNKGSYFPVIAIANGGEFLYRQPGPVLQVASNRETLAWGLVTLDYEWRQQDEPCGQVERRAESVRRV